MFKNFLLDLIIATILFFLIYPIGVTTAFWGRSNLILADMTGSSYRIITDSLNSGGSDFSSSSNYVLSDTIGEIATGESTSTSYKILAGYRQMEEDTFISISAEPDVNLPQIFGVTGGDSVGSSTWTVITNNPGGYELSVRSSTSPAMIASNGTDSFADYVSSGGGNSLTTDLISYWELEESTSTRFDSHGSNDLTEYGTVASTTGILGDAANVDAINDNLRNSSIIDGNVFSVSFWVKDVTTLSFDRIINIRPGGAFTNEGLIIATENSTQLDFATRNGGNYGSINNIVTHGTLDTWVHFVAVYETYTTLTVYRNGVATNNTAGGAWNAVAGTGIALGASVSGTVGATVKMDEVGIWSRALSADDVDALYNSGAGLSYDDFSSSSASSTPDFTFAIASTTSAFGFTPEGSHVVDLFLDDGSANCNVTSGSNTADKCWSGFSTTTTVISQSDSPNAPSGTETTVKYKAESGSANLQPVGNYSATIIVTAVSL